MSKLTVSGRLVKEINKRINFMAISDGEILIKIYKII